MQAAFLPQGAENSALLFTKTMTFSQVPDYYALLGVQRNADADTIKRRYRELARRYHPDINPGQDAQQKIKAVNEAYHVLGDAERRALYDAEYYLRQQRRENAEKTSAARTAAQPAAAPKAAKTDSVQTNQGVEFNGFGRVYNSSAAKTSPAAHKPGVQTGPEVSLLIDARNAFMSHRYTDAEKLCRQVLGINPRMAEAHEIMGDIFMRKGAEERAVTAYSYALQFNPANLGVQTKLQRLGKGMAAGGPKVHVNRKTPRKKDALAQERMLMGIGILSSLMFLSLLAFYYFLKGPLLLTLFYLVCIGCLGGLLLGLLGGIKPLRGEISLWKADRVALPYILIGSALLSFYLSFLLFTLAAYVQKKASLPILSAYGGTAVLVMLCWFLYPAAGLWMPALAGNLLFPALMAGWNAADWLRQGDYIARTG